MAYDKLKILGLQADIEEALEGKIDGEAASKEECDKLILESVDEIVSCFNAAIDKLVRDADYFY